MFRGIIYYLLFVIIHNLYLSIHPLDNNNNKCKHKQWLWNYLSSENNERKIKQSV